MSVVVVDAAPDFLLAKPGDIVVVEEARSAVGGCKTNWWIGLVIHVIGGARDPRINSLFQLACVDTGKIRTINADLVKGILIPKALNS